jgi:hypothetical protein
MDAVTNQQKTKIEKSRWGRIPSEDWLTASGASALAEEIKEFWRERGAAVSVTVSPAGRTASLKTTYQVRSDLKNGLPRDWKTARKIYRGSK